MQIFSLRISSTVTSTRLLGNPAAAGTLHNISGTRPGVFRAIPYSHKIT